MTTVALIVSVIIALVLVVSPNAYIGEVSGSYAVLIALAMIGALGFLAIVSEVFIRWLMSAPA